MKALLKEGGQCLTGVQPGGQWTPLHPLCPRSGPQTPHLILLCLNRPGPGSGLWPSTRWPRGRCRPLTHSSSPRAQGAVVNPGGHSPGQLSRSHLQGPGTREVHQQASPRTDSVTPTRYTGYANKVLTSYANQASVSHSESGSGVAGGTQITGE